MKHKLLIFIEISLLSIFLILLNIQAPLGLRVITKTLLMPVLIVFVLLNTQNFNKFIYLVILALTLSMFGDLFMELQSGNDKFFFPGLGCFLGAHIFYISAFSYKLQTKLLTWSNLIFLLLLTVAVFALLTYLWPKLGQMKIPVLFYAIIISVATFTAYIRSCKEQRICILFWGALLFLLSDALLSIYLFKTPFPGAREINMILYITGQTLIAIGTILINKQMTWNAK